MSDTNNVVVTDDAKAKLKVRLSNEIGALFAEYPRLSQDAIINKTRNTLIELENLLEIRRYFVAKDVLELMVATGRLKVEDRVDPDNPFYTLGDSAQNAKEELKEVQPSFSPKLFPFIDSFNILKDEIVAAVDLHNGQVRTSLVFTTMIAKDFKDYMAAYDVKEVDARNRAANIFDEAVASLVAEHRLQLSGGVLRTPRAGSTVKQSNDLRDALEIIALAYLGVEIVMMEQQISAGQPESEGVKLLKRVRGVILDHGLEFRLTRPKEGEFGIPDDMCKVQLVKTLYPMDAELLPVILETFYKEGY